MTSLLMAAHPERRLLRVADYVKSLGATSIYVPRFSSGQVSDRGANNIALTITGATPAKKHGYRGISFDGTNDEASVSSAAFDYTTVADFTMMCLFNLTDVVSTGTLMAVHTADAAIYAHFYHNNAELNWRVEKAPAATQRRGTTTLSLVADRWYLFTLTKVGVADVQVYVGATENTSRSADHSFDDGGQAAAATRLGVNRSAAVQTFGKGVMAFAAFAPLAFSASQIASAASIARV